MILTRAALCLLVFLLTVPILRGQPPKPTVGDEMFDKYLAAEAKRLSVSLADTVNDAKAWADLRPKLREQYFCMLGLWPLPEKTPLKATVTGTLEHEGVAIEKLHYQSRPGLYVTANLYRPKKVDGKLPAVLYVCGHSGRGRDGNKTAFQDHGLWFARNGYVCLIVDTLQLGEIPGIHHGTYNQGRWWWHSAGYTSAGVECWNGVRGIDYLVSRPDVDSQRIAVTGISGGGAATLWIAGADDRVACAVPVSGMSDLESYVSNKIINGHCDCMLLHNVHGWEWTTIAMLTAPRPLLFANSDNDRIFPMDGNRRIIERLRKLYQTLGKSELVDEYVSKGGHDYRPDLRIAVFQWINKHVKKDTAPVEDADFKLLPGKELRVFPEDSNVPADALNGKIDETFVPRAVVKPPVEGGFAEWKKSLMVQLRQRVFRALPERMPAVKLDRPGQNALPDFAPETEPGIQVRWGYDLAARPGTYSGGTLVVRDANDDSTKYPEWAGPYLKGRLGALLSPRGVAGTAWTPKSPPNYVERAHVLVGQTVDTGRVRDVAALVRGLRAWRIEEWRVVGRGRAGVIAAYAALFEPDVAEVVVIDPPASHRDGPHFLNVLRTLDIPEALGMLAPRPLTLVNAPDAVYERTAAIYRAAGAADKLTRK